MSFAFPFLILTGLRGNTGRHSSYPKGGIGEGNGLLWVAMITSAENRAWPGDVPFGDFYHQAGLPAPSVIRTCKLATIEVRHAEPLGQISTALMRQVVNTLREYLGLR